MKKGTLLLCLSALITLSNGNLLYAIGDGSPNSTDLPAGSGFLDFQVETGESLIITGGIENVSKKPLERESGILSPRIKGQWHLAGIGYRINDGVEPYIRFGTSEMDILWNQHTRNVELNGDLGIALGAGLKLLALRTQLTNLAKLKINLDGQVRYTTADIGTVNVGGASRSVSAEEFSIVESRVAVTAGFEISLKKVTDRIREWGLELEEEEERQVTIEGPTVYLIPYAGVVLTASLVDAEFTYDNTLYKLSDVGDKELFHLIGGIDFIAPQYLILNVEGQVLDGESISGGLSLKF